MEDRYKYELNIESKIADQVLSIIDRYRSIDRKSSLIIKDEVLGRFHKVSACFNQLFDIHQVLFEKDISEDELGEESQWHLKRLITSFGLPDNIDISGDRKLETDWLEWVEETINFWAAGECSHTACSELLVELDEIHDLDEIYILYGLSGNQLNRLAYNCLLSFTYDHGTRNFGKAADDELVQDDELVF